VITDTLSFSFVKGEFRAMGTGDCKTPDGVYPNRYEGTAADLSTCRSMCSQLATCFAFQFSSADTICMVFVPDMLENSAPADFNYVVGSGNSCPELIVSDAFVVYEKRSSQGSAWTTFADKKYDCSKSEYRGQLGTFASARECLSAARYNSDINFVVWRGDVDRVCHGCSVADAVLTDWKDAVTFKSDLYGCSVSSKQNGDTEWFNPSAMSSDLPNELAVMDSKAQYLTVGNEADVQGWCVYDNSATCKDNFQNGDEVGVDCGGSCACPCTKGVCRRNLY